MLGLQMYTITPDLCGAEMVGAHGTLCMLGDTLPSE